MNTQRSAQAGAPGSAPATSNASSGGAAGALKSELRGQDFAAGDRALTPVQRQDGGGTGALGRKAGVASGAASWGSATGRVSAGPVASVKGTSPDRADASRRVPGDGDGAPKDDTEAKTEGMQGLSQFVWVSTSGKDLTYDQAKERIPIICNDMGLGTYLGEITAPTDKEKTFNPNNGYYWFADDGSPTWSGKSGGTKAIKIGLSWSQRLNVWSDFLSTSPVGKRPGYMLDAGAGKVSFSATQKETYVEVPDQIRNLDVKHVPGAASCFATVIAMLDQVGLTPVNGGDGFGETVTGETYATATEAKYDKGDITDEATKLAVEYFRKGFVERDKLAAEVWYALHPEKVVDGARQPVDKKNGDEKAAWDGVAKICKSLCGEKKTVASVTVDLKESKRSMTYIDFETLAGRAVMVGVTYTARNGNGKFTDHWVVINGRLGAGKYSFFDPAASSTLASEDTGNVFVWDEGLGYMQSTGKHPYVVSWVRPNAESLKDWQAHETSLGLK